MQEKRLLFHMVGELIKTKQQKKGGEGGGLEVTGVWIQFNIHLPYFQNVYGDILYTSLVILIFGCLAK